MFDEGLKKRLAAAAESCAELVVVPEQFTTHHSVVLILVANQLLKQPTDKSVKSAVSKQLQTPRPVILPLQKKEGGRTKWE